METATIEVRTAVSEAAATAEVTTLQEAEIVEPQEPSEAEQELGRIAFCKTCPVTEETCGTEPVCNAFGCTLGGGGRRRLL